MKYPLGKLMVFCKAPEAGKVMTRLATALNDIGLEGSVIAARVHQFLTLERLRQATKDALSPVELWCSPDKDHPFFRRCEKMFPVILKEQPEGDLGARMAYAFDDALSNASYAVLIGTDCPGLDSSMIEQALQYLNDKPCSVIGPAEDGGYVLIGLTEQQPDIFRGIEWGSSQVCTITLQRLAGITQQLPRLWDLDRIEDLEKLKKESRNLNLDNEFIDYLDSIKLHDYSLIDE